MRKRRSISQRVRDLLNGNPKATCKEIQTALGRKVSPNIIYNVMSQRRKNTSRSQRVNIRDVVLAKRFAERRGGIQHARQALAMFERLKTA